MPELPEVENVVQGLRKNIIGKKIEKLEIISEAIVNRDVKRINRALKQNILAVKRRGKYIIIELEEGFLLAHLRMTGKLLYQGEIDKHVHLILKFADGSYLAYKDVRKFGRVIYLNKEELAAYLDKKVGLEPLEMSLQEFISKVKPKKGPIKKNLLDQGIIAGIGNIYADEILFTSFIKPQYSTEKLTEEDYKKLYDNMKSILSMAIEVGGSTIKDYVDSSGKAGGFQNFHKVYGRGGQSCNNCSQMLEKTKIAGRTTVYCPKCQKG